MTFRPKRAFTRHMGCVSTGFNAGTLVTTVHSQPSGATFAVVREVAASGLITPVLAPALAVSLAMLDLD